MQNNFEISAINKAKEILKKDLQMAEHIHGIQKERQKEWQRRPSLWKQFKIFFNKYF